MLYPHDWMCKDHEPESNLDFESDDDDAIPTPAASQEGSVQEVDDESDDSWEPV